MFSKSSAILFQQLYTVLSKMDALSENFFFYHFAMVIKKIFKITILGSEYYRASEIRKSMLIRQRDDRKERKSKKLKIKETTGGCLLSLVTLFAAFNMLKIVTITEKKGKKSPFKFTFSAQWLDIIGFLFPASVFSTSIFFPQGNILKYNLV